MPTELLNFCAVAAVPREMSPGIVHITGTDILLKYCPAHRKFSQFGHWNNLPTLARFEATFWKDFLQMPASVPNVKESYRGVFNIVSNQGIPPSIVPRSEWAVGFAWVTCATGSFVFEGIKAFG